MPLRNAQLAKKVVFYFSRPPEGTGEILMGLPEEFFAPNGFEKIVCTTVAEAERWSDRMRKWEATKEEIAQMYQRHQEEKQYRELLSDIDDKIRNARNNINMDFMKQVRARAVKNYEDRYAWKRESYLHSEAYSADDKSVKETKARLPKKLHVSVGDFDE